MTFIQSKQTVTIFQVIFDKTMCFWMLLDMCSCPYTYQAWLLSEERPTRMLFDATILFVESQSLKRHCTLISASARLVTLISNIILPQQKAKTGLSFASQTPESKKNFLFQNWVTSCVFSDPRFHWSGNGNPPPTMRFLLSWKFVTSKVARRKCSNEPEPPLGRKFLNFVQV